VGVLVPVDLERHVGKQALPPPPPPPQTLLISGPSWLAVSIRAAWAVRDLQRHAGEARRIRVEAAAPRVWAWAGCTDSTCMVAGLPVNMQVLGPSSASRLAVYSQRSHLNMSPSSSSVTCPVAAAVCHDLTEHIMKFILHHENLNST
jgi:hypothetical protein